MAEIRTKVSNNPFPKLPKRQRETREVLQRGLKPIHPLRKKPLRSVVDETFAAIPIKDHKLIAQVIEQLKYGE